MSNKDFSKLSDILNESVLADKKLGQAFEQGMSFGMSFSMFLNFWKNIVGKKFEKLSIPYDIKGRTLFVSVISPVILQELSFFKADIIKKAAPYAEGLNFKINDIKFDYKNWQSVKNGTKGENPSKAFDTDIPDYYTDEDFETIGLDNNEEKEFEILRKTINDIEFLPASVKTNMYKNAMNQYKAQKLRKHGGKNNKNLLE